MLKAYVHCWVGCRWTDLVSYVEGPVLLVFFGTSKVSLTRCPDAVSIALALLVLATGWSEAVNGDGVSLGFRESPVAVAAVTVDT